MLKWIKDQSVGEAAYAVGCNGRDHKVVDER
jgi:hypothetical protein